MLEFLPPKIKNAIDYCNSKCLYELRLRADMPITVNYSGKYVYLSARGIANARENAIICTLEEIESCVYKAGNYSIYSIEEQMRQGFITAKGGVRIGLAGEYVMEKGRVHAIRGISSLCIRIPHDVYGCGEGIFKSCMSDRIHSLLVCSSPGLGKTTILRDISRIISKNGNTNIVICDERGELSVGATGETCDIIRYTDKATAFEIGIRALRPDIIITDELSERDCIALRKAMDAGVQVIATAHFSDISYIKTPFLELFERFVVLDAHEIGKIKGIYNQMGEVIL